jgi:hypothetical protein
VVLIFKGYSKSFHFFTKIVAFDVFIALLNFDDILCGCKILVGCYNWETPIVTPSKCCLGLFGEFQLVRLGYIQ